MDQEFLANHWAPLAALVILAIAALRVAPLVWRETSRGRLAVQSRRLRAAHRAREAAIRDVERQVRKVASLEQKSDRIRPRDLSAARGRLVDAKALARIRSDQAMVEANRLRKVIFEEFPPARHDDLRARYLPEDLAEGRPIA